MKWLQWNGYAARIDSWPSTYSVAFNERLQHVPEVTMPWYGTEVQATVNEAELLSPNGRYNAFSLALQYDNSHFMG